jgi:hypothetical protein
MINLLPKKKQNQMQPNYHPKQIGIFVGITILVFSVCFCLGYLGYKVSLNEARLEQLDLEMKCYNTSFRKVENFESLLERIQDQNKLKQTVYAGYLAPLNALNTLIKAKPDLVWFERIQLHGMEGMFSVTGGADNYIALAGFIGKLEQDEVSFGGLKPEQATMRRNSAGREYVQFKISGILVRKDEKSVQNN